WNSPACRNKSPQTHFATPMPCPRMRICYTASLNGVRKLELKSEHMKSFVVDRVLLLVVIVTAAVAAAPADQQDRSTLPDDPEKAWEEVDKIHEILRPPDSFRQGKPDANEVEKFRKQLRASSQEFAGKARE